MTNRVTPTVLAGAQSTLRGRLPLHLRRRVQEGGAALHGGQHPAVAVLRRQHPHPVSLPQALCQGGWADHTIQSVLPVTTVSVCARARPSSLLPPPPPAEASDWLLCLHVQCVNAGMDTLTLARYYCELSLMEMEMVTERGSVLASACLLMALVHKDLGGWVGPLLICFFSSFPADNGFVSMTPKIA